MHYNILFVDKRQHPIEPQWWTRYGMYVSEDLIAAAKLYAHLHEQFCRSIVTVDDYNMFDLILEEDPNFDGDCSTFKFKNLKVLPDIVNQELDYILEHPEAYEKTWVKFGEDNND